MRPLTDALALIPEGWSLRYECSDRAVLMREHAKAGNHQRAEEYAAEISAIQRAWNEHHGYARKQPVWAVSEWRYTPRAWAELIIGGGWLVQRGIWAAEGWTAENVAGEAHRCHPQGFFAATDVMPPSLTVARAAA